MIIKLVRHGQSQSNVGIVDASRIGDHNVELTLIGKRQSRFVGKIIFAENRRFIDYDSITYHSPYRRTRQTMQEIMSVCPSACVPPQLEDPRLREVEWGYDKPEDYGNVVDEAREIHGKFYYRMAGGESPADCFDRISTFIDTLWRQIKRKQANKVLIVTHGLTIRCFVMRWMHLTVEEFNDIWNPKNGDIITISDEVETDQFSSGKWRVNGLRLPKRGEPGPRPYPWKCFVCKKEEVWPRHSPPNLETTDRWESWNQCENCNEKQKD